jgi:ABC-type phosphate transport system substrate-binding protein
MELITERARLPLHLTYRAVGSSTGQKEFVGDQNTPPNTPWNHFGAGDIPVTSSRYSALTAAGRQMVHVPFAMGGIGVFHSVPSDSPIDLDGCLLARIFSREITSWDHPDIKALNPSLSYSGDIKVVHRVRGSSSTAGFTEYLEGHAQESCVSSWTLGSGSTIVWPSGTFEAQGSGGMASYIAANEGAIGYIDAGHGHSAGLSEIALQNRDGHYLTTTTANIGAAGDIALSAVPSVIPSDPSADFSSVNLYDLSGPTTWPITMISYFYIEKDLSAMDDVTAGLLLYFVRFILSEEGQTLAEQNLFVKLPQVLLDYNVVTLASLTTALSIKTFTTELASTTLAQTGAGQFVISGKRRSFSEVTGTTNAANIADLEAVTAQVCVRGVCVGEEVAAEVAIAGLALASVGFLFGLTSFLMAVVLCCRARTSKPRSVEIKARDLELPNSTTSQDSHA